MRKHKILLITLIILLLASITALFFARNFFSKSGDKFTTTETKESVFATGGEIDNTTRRSNFNGSFEPTGGYTPLKLDVSTCSEGRDSVNFALGHTEFLVRGMEGTLCVFKYGTEIEDPRWNGELGITCRVPSTTTVSLTINNDGIDFSPIKQYCSGNE